LLNKLLNKFLNNLLGIMRKKLLDGAHIIIEKLKAIPQNWNGKTSILEMKKSNFNWKQMEWWGFYFELLIRNTLKNDSQFPGDIFDNVKV
jgi:hypothetical protein